MYLNSGHLFCFLIRVLFFCSVPNKNKKKNSVQGKRARKTDGEAVWDQRPQTVGYPL